MVDLLSNNQNGVQAKREHMGLVVKQGKDKVRWVMRQAFGTAEAVSYTHLDVYKRQLYDSPGVGQRAGI